MEAAYSFESWYALTSSSVTTQKNYKVNTPQETFKYYKQKFFFRSVVQLLLYYLSHTKKPNTLIHNFSFHVIMVLFYMYKANIFILRMQANEFVLDLKHKVP